MCPTMVSQHANRRIHVLVVFLATIVLNQTKHIVQYSVITNGMGWIQNKISEFVLQIVSVLHNAKNKHFLDFGKGLLGRGVEIQNVHLFV